MGARRLFVALARRMRYALLLGRRAARRGRPLFDVAQGLLLCGTGRSGTTWLGGLLAQAPGILAYTEPLWEGGRPLERYGVSSRRLRAPGEAWPEGAAFFHDLFTGRLLDQGWLEDASLKRARTARAVLAKCIKAHFLLPWLVEHLDLAGYVLIVRHPCAVVASMRKHPRFDAQASLERVAPCLRDALPGGDALLRRCTHPHQAFALRWAAEQRAALSVLDHPKVHLVPYEHLVAQGRDTLLSLWKALALPGDGPAEATVRRSSREARAWSVPHEKASVDERLAAWTRDLRGDEAEEILSIVSACGLEGWTPDPWVVPDAIGLSDPASRRRLHAPTAPDVR